MKALAKGLATFVPGAYSVFSVKQLGGASSARYCYGVWLRHLVLCCRHGLPGVPKSVAELGPGDSIGTGLAALLSGAETYSGLDVVRYSSLSSNLRVLDELVELFRARAPIPGNDEFPKMKPFLEDYSFPSGILADRVLDAALAPHRIEAIRRSVSGQESDGPRVKYFAPWFSPSVVAPESVDMVYSQAVLEHVEDVSQAYAALHRWLKPGGIMSHQIDFTSHGITAGWDGYRAFGDFMWKLVKGRRPYLINRVPHCGHVAMQEKAGFSVVADVPFRLEPTVTGPALATRFATIPQDDLSVSGAYILSRKP